jgi:ATP-dependent RNA helicase SUPV3L1/SUV3
MTDATSSSALLGPTNTGKTHRAIERMLEHETGMIGLPLRLLAREVWDRVAAKVGEEHVALVTGEEKRVPARPRYWVCTVEAMPVERDVEFVAVDEIQLAAHEQRGHVFTDRLLRLRGTKETWFLGASTMSDAIAELVPAAKRVAHPRLSKLSHAGTVPISRLPPRSAVVAFSMSQVYEIAEKLRLHRGGTAVVLGSLSPRTRNAQVAMFQAGEVDYLVATDAIGMGLNLDVHHVAFAGLRKFDGRDVRDLDVSEVAQIAGRAGRWIQDGTFGSLAPFEFPRALALAVEHHDFAPIRKLQWRSADLDFTTLDALSESLRTPPRSRWLRPVQGATDAEAFEHLRRRPSVVTRASTAERVRLLWDVASIPDFERLLFESYAQFLESLYMELTGPHARLTNDFVAPQVAALEDTEGDVDVLVSRLASIRTWTYVASSPLRVEDAKHWQERTRVIEDKLGDALHASLVRRFVDEQPKKRVVAKPHARPPKKSSTELTIDASHPFSKLAKLREQLSPVTNATPANDYDELLAAPFTGFAVDEKGRVQWRDLLVARLVLGARLCQPNARLLLEDLGATMKMQLAEKMTSFARDYAARVFAPVARLGLSEERAEERGLRYSLEEGLGRIRREDAEPAFALLREGRLDELTRKGLRLSERFVWVDGLSKAKAQRYRGMFAV